MIYKTNLFVVIMTVVIVFFIYLLYVVVDFRGIVKKKIHERLLFII